jgi:hypothetical protein
MRFSYVGLGVKILILAAAVTGVFMLLVRLSPALLSGNDAAAGGALPKNILLVLMENWEKQLQAMSSELEKEKAAALQKLSAAVDPAERRRAQAEVKKLEQDSGQNEARLAEADLQMKELAARESARLAGQDVASGENRKTADELMSVKLYWSGYLETIKQALLGQAKSEEEKENIQAAFQENNGLSYLTRMAGDYSTQGSKLAASQGDIAMAKDELARTLGDKSKAEAYVRELEGKVTSGNAAIARNEAGIRNLQAQVETLLNQSGVNGFFIGGNGAVTLIIDKKKETEILRTGTFMVYDAKKKQTSKIYVVKNGGAIQFTKLPGYANPKPGDWF